MLNYDAIVTKRADEIIPGDILDTRCGVADYAWKTVTKIRYIDVDVPGCQDRVELTLDTDAMCPTREASADAEYRVIPVVSA